MRPDDQDEAGVTVSGSRKLLQLRGRAPGSWPWLRRPTLARILYIGPLVVNKTVIEVEKKQELTDKFGNVRNSLLSLYYKG